jgi:putative colanic acid biosynthesis acetyltransferase WcaF
MSEATAQPLRRSVWTKKEKLIRLLWDTGGRLLWLAIPGARSAMIRMFGGVVGEGCTFSSSAEITIPWNLVIGDNVRVGELARLYSLGTITIGSGTVIDARAHLCAGTHDFTDSTFPLTRPPITIGSGSLIGIDAYIGPGVTLGDRCVVHPRASVYKDFHPGAELIGNPARPVGPTPDGDL